MPYGWTGTNLEVDLTKGSVQKVKGAPELVRAYLGGKGLGAKILWDRVPPETEPFSHDNLIIISNGLLVDTPVPAANRGIMTYISPVTELYHHSAIGGFWSPEIKHAGYDTIIIGGKSPTPVYLWINNDQVEIRDAGHLWGKDTIDTRSMIREELENEKVQIACIGQAGENKVYAAAVQCGTGGSASRGGIGALWGDKKLKAVAVYGTQDVSVAHPDKLIEMSNYILDKSDKLTEFRRGKSLFTTNRWETRDVWYGNFNEQDYGHLPPDSDLKKQVDKIEEKLSDLIQSRGVRLMSCYNCRVNCLQAFSYRGGLTFLKCTSLLGFMVYAKHFDYDWALDCYNMCEEWGLDILSFPRYVALAIDLYERGILTQEDTNGMHLEFGNPEIFTTLMKKIVRREGIGDVLANGTLRAAQQIGRGAEERVNTVKGLELLLPAPFLYEPHRALSTAVCDKEDLSGQVGGDTLAWYTRPWSSNVAGAKEAKEAYLKEGWFMYPKKYEEYFLSEPGFDGVDYEPFCQFIAFDQDHFSITDTLGVCHRTCGFGRYLPINSRAQMAELVSNATGMDIDEDELTTIAKRTVNLIKAYNLRRGLTRKDDTVPKIYFEREPFPPRRKLDPVLFNTWLDRFYELRGWNREGVPTKETLEECGLVDVHQDLKKRGILKEEEALTT